MLLRIDGKFIQAIAHFVSSVPFDIIFGRWSHCCREMVPGPKASGKRLLAPGRNFIDRDLGFDIFSREGDAVCRIAMLATIFVLNCRYDWCSFQIRLLWLRILELCSKSSISIVACPYTTWYCFWFWVLQIGNADGLNRLDVAVSVTFIVSSFSTILTEKSGFWPFEKASCQHPV